MNLSSQNEYENTIQLEDFFVVEYSVKQKAFNIDNARSRISKGLKNVMANKNTDYEFIGLFSTMEEATEYVNQINTLIAEKSGISSENSKM